MFYSTLPNSILSSNICDEHCFVPIRTILTDILFEILLIGTL